MTALVEDRSTPAWGGGDGDDELEVAIASNVRIFKGLLVCGEAGYATPGREATGLVALGCAQERRDNRTNAPVDQRVPGMGGDERIRIRKGTFGWGNSAGADEITAADRFADCYVVDDQTVARTDGSGTRSKAGRVVAVEAANGIYPSLVWVATT